MAITPLSNSSQTSSLNSPLQPPPKPPETQPAIAVDTVEIGAAPPETLTYQDPRKANAAGPANLTALMEESDRKAQQIIALLGDLVQKQGLNWAKVASGEQKLSADPADIAAAKQAISPDGEFGVRKTAERILNFAKSAMGEDPAKLATFRAAVEKGFSEAKDMLGGTLPEISLQTHDAIMAEFDRWEKEGIPGGTVSLATPDQSAVAPVGNTSGQVSSSSSAG